MLSLPFSSKAALLEILETSMRPIPLDWHDVLLGSQKIGAISAPMFMIIENFLNYEEHHLGFIRTSKSQLLFQAQDPYELSLDLRVLSEYLRDQGHLEGWRNEDFSWLDDEDHERFRMERSAFRTLGLQSRATHVNGYTKQNKLWLSKRSLSKSIDPGLLDNLSAGGIGADETIRNCALRELWEEAGVSLELARHIQPIGMITTQRQIDGQSNGLHHESLYSFDLLLPDSWQPQNQDGEVSEFILVNYEDAVSLILSEQLTQDSKIITSDFLLRHSS
jgi:8-oxo-dGTP pyrophosphatase MutT (NUDIX family)